MQADNAPARPEIEHDEDQALLLTSASDFVSKRADFASVRATLTTASGYDAALYREVAELGFVGIGLPAAYGGSDLPVAALVNVVEPMGRALLVSPLIASTLAAQAILHAGSEDQKQAWLPRLASGQATAAFALSEPEASFDPEYITATATPSGDKLTLTGKKTSVLDGQNAEVIVVAVRHAGKPALVLVPRAALGDRLRSEGLVDETRRSARLLLDGVQVEKTALLDGGDALSALRHVQRVAWLLLSAEMAGGAEGVLQLTLEYLKTRKQFGKLIGGYQALKHPMVEIMCALEEGRSLLYHAATVFERDPMESEVATRMAKARLGDGFVYAADRSIQFHGAIGFTYECHAQLFFRRAQWSQYTFGDSVQHRKRLAELLWPVARA